MSDVIVQQWSVQMDKSAERFHGGDLLGAEQVLKNILTDLPLQSLSVLQRAETLSRLVLILSKENKLAEAQHYLQEAITIMQESGLQSNPFYLTLLLQNLNILRALPDKNNYRHTLENTLKTFEYALGDGHANTQALLKELLELNEQERSKNSVVFNTNQSVPTVPSLQTVPVLKPIPDQNLEQYKQSQQSVPTLQSIPAYKPEQSTLNRGNNLNGQSSSPHQEAEHKAASEQNRPEAQIVMPEQDLDSYILPREKVYKNISLTIGIIGYLILLVAFNLSLILVIPGILLFSYIINGLFSGRLRGSSIRVSPDQLPEINKMVEDICGIMNMAVPAVYVSNGEGMLNAFATRLLSRDFVVLYSNILEMAYEKGENEVAFVVAHELAHIKRGHTKWQFMYMPARIVPFLENAYSRARESTCDRIGAAICPTGAKWGLVALAAGSKIYRQVDLPSLYKQFDDEHSFWTWFAELLSTHPNLIRRIKLCGVAVSGIQTDVAMNSQPRHRPELQPRFLPNFIK